nr:hypothetical protein [Candidatus Frankia alpina]
MTAYSFSAGGPIVSPSVEALLVPRPDHLRRAGRPQAAVGQLRRGRRPRPDPRSRSRSRSRISLTRRRRRAGGSAARGPRPSGGRTRPRPRCGRRGAPASAPPAPRCRRDRGDDVPARPAGSSTRP